MVVDKKRVIVGVVGLVLVERRRWFSGKKKKRMIEFVVSIVVELVPISMEDGGDYVG
jgi:hypothetical protein